MGATSYKHGEQDYCASFYRLKERPQYLGELSERRRKARLSRRFPVRLCNGGSYFPVGGVTENIGPCGALIKLNDLHAFRVHTWVILTLFLPPSFSGQEITIRLQGSAQIVRLVGDNGGVALEFVGSLKQFKRTND